jgi:hypothetical protein
METKEIHFEDFFSTDFSFDQLSLLWTITTNFLISGRSYAEVRVELERKLHVLYSHFLLLNSTCVPYSAGTQNPFKVSQLLPFTSLLMRSKARGLAQHGGPPGWLEESDPAGVILYVMDGWCHLPFPYSTGCPGWFTQGRHGQVPW